MNEILTLLKPRLYSFKNSGSSAGAGGLRFRVYVFGAIGLAFWVGIFAVFFRVLTYFQGIAGLGDLLAVKLLSMVLLTFTALLIFSSIITALSKLYLSRDLMLVHSLPVAPRSIFLARWIESTVDSSWMVVLYSLPVFLSYGVVYGAGSFFYLAILLSFVPLCLTISALSAAVVMAVAVILPAGRIRTLIVAISVVLFVVLLLAFRLMRPEELTNPENFTSVVQYFRSLQTPGSALLPTTWVFDSIRAALSGARASSIFHLSLSLSFAGAAVCGTAWLSEVLYFRGYARAQTTPGRLFAASPRRPANWQKVLGLLSGPARAFVIKEVRTFFRDQTQWPQLFLIGALVAIYLYNFSVLPLERSPIRLTYLQNTISFLNMGLAVFVLTAVAARFVFPAVSMEGDAFWIVKAAPVPIRTFLWIKFFVYYLPLLVMTEILIVVTNLFLQVTPFMMALSTVTVFCMAPGVVAMAVGLGAVYPDFKSENPAQAATSFGGLVFMILCAGFIGIVALLEAGPTHAIFMAGVRNAHLTPLQWVWTAASFAAALTLCAAAVYVPMRLGEKRLSDLG
ncbi:MAG: hypothetical protein A4E73_02026 [Syntrophaceae bacterium PtaU1.Bin231]|nr:MAG: hypothetical protein A4E73_02026 [Syntrophaceae bacterium PtaU1.Bin231]HOG18561.1 hypothetical protein [Syntrophales bacterium]